MFSCTYWTNYNGPVDHIYLPPREWGLGAVRDIFGERWHVWGYVGAVVYAVKLWEAHSYLTSTASDVGGSYSQSWRPYHLHRVETIEGGRYGH